MLDQKTAMSFLDSSPSFIEETPPPAASRQQQPRYVQLQSDTVETVYRVHVMDRLVSVRLDTALFLG